MSLVRSLPLAGLAVIQLTWCPLVLAQPVRVGPQFQVNTYTPFHQTDPAVATDQAGNFVVVWASHGGSGSDKDDYSVQGQRYDSAGMTQGDQFQVNTYTTSFQSFPAVATDGTGNFMVIWHSNGSAGSDTDVSVQGQRYDNTGAALGNQFRANQTSPNAQSFAAVAADAMGKFVVVWQSVGSTGSDTSNESIQSRRYDSITALSGESQVNTYTTAHQEMPAVATDATGNFVVVWQSHGSVGSDTSGFSIQGQRFDSAGVAQGGQFQVNTYTTSTQISPAVASDSAGDFVVVWVSYGSAGSDTANSSIQGQRYDSAGVAQGGQFQVNTFTTQSQLRPAVATDGTGNFVVVWESYGSFGSDTHGYTSGYSIQGQRYDRAGVAQGGQFQVNTYTTGHQTAAAVATDGADNFVVVWGSLGSSGSDTHGNSIQGQRFAVPTTTSTSTPAQEQSTTTTSLPFAAVPTTTSTSTPAQEQSTTTTSLPLTAAARVLVEANPLSPLVLVAYSTRSNEALGFGGEIDKGRVRRIRQVLYTVNASTFSVNFNRRGFPVSVRADDGSRIDIKKKGGTLRLKPRLQNVPAQSRTATTLAVTAAPTAESTQCVASRLGFRSSVGFTREQIQNGFRVGDNAIGLGVADIVDEGLCATQNIVERVFSIATRDPDASIFDLARNFLQSDVLAAMEQGGRSTAVVEVLLDAETIAREDDLQVGAGKVALERAIKAARDYSFAIQKKLERLFGPRIADSRPAALAPDAPVAPYPVSEPTQPTEPPASATTTSSTTTSTTTLPFIPLLYSGTFGPVSAGSAGCGGNVTINGDMAITISGEAGEDARGVVNWTASFAQFGPLAYSASGPLDPLSYTGLLRMTRFSTAEITSFQNGYAQVTIVSGVQIRRSGETAFCFDGTVTASVGVRMDRTGGD